MHTHRHIFVKSHVPYLFIGVVVQKVGLDEISTFYLMMRDERAQKAEDDFHLHNTWVG